MNKQISIGIFTIISCYSYQNIFKMLEFSRMSSMTCLLEVLFSAKKKSGNLTKNLEALQKIWKPYEKSGNLTKNLETLQKI